MLPDNSRFAFDFFFVPAKGGPVLAFKIFGQYLLVFRYTFKDWSFICRRSG